jgi:hypothetical protein
MTLPCAVEPEDRREPVAQVNPAASKLGTPVLPPALLEAVSAELAAEPAAELPAELASLPADELPEPAAELAAELAGEFAAELWAEVAAEVAEVVGEELLSLPHAARVMAPAAINAASAVILVFFTAFVPFQVGSWPVQARPIGEP